MYINIHILIAFAIYIGPETLYADTKYNGGPFLGAIDIYIFIHRML